MLITPEPNGEDILWGFTMACNSSTMSNVGSVQNVVHSQMAILNGNMMINRGNRTNDLTLNMWILMGSSWDLSRYAVGYRKDYINQLYPICVCVCVLNIGYCRSPSGNFNEEHDNDKPWVRWAKVGCHSGVSKGIVSDSGGMVREENQLVDGQFPQK